MTMKNFNELTIGEIFEKSTPVSNSRESLFIKIRRNNGKLGAMFYEDFIAMHANNYVSEESVRIFSDCSHWYCVPCSDPYLPPVKEKETSEKKIDKPYLLINNDTGELFRISAEGANIYEYLSENEGDTYSLINFTKNSKIKEF